jgi:hypothetical protein
MMKQHCIPGVSNTATVFLRMPVCFSHYLPYAQTTVHIFSSQPRCGEFWQQNGVLLFLMYIGLNTRLMFLKNLIKRKLRYVGELCKS